MAGPSTIESPEGRPAQDAPAAPAAGQAAALLEAVRPRQWMKNVLVVAVPAAAGEVTDPAVALQTAGAFVAFCLASSATYLLNDVSDAGADRLHPVKRRRPVAAGRLSTRRALSAGAAALVVALGLAAVVNVLLAATVAGYFALSAAYTWRLKHEPVLDIAAVAAGFFLRAVAGGVASDLFISRWFLLVAAGASVFVVAGKRYAEARTGGTEAHRARRVLASYSTNYLTWVLTVAAAVTLLAYCLWAFEDGGELQPAAAALSAVPFTLAIMRYGLLVDHGHGEEPEEVLLGDRPLQLMGLCWLGLLGLGAVL